MKKNEDRDIEKSIEHPYNVQKHSDWWARGETEKQK